MEYLRNLATPQLSAWFPTNSSINPIWPSNYNFIWFILPKESRHQLPACLGCHIVAGGLPHNIKNGWCQARLVPRPGLLTHMWLRFSLCGCGPKISWLFRVFLPAATLPHQKFEPTSPTDICPPTGNIGMQIGAFCRAHRDHSKSAICRSNGQEFMEW